MENKRALLALLCSLDREAHFVQLLHRARTLPEHSYTAPQWQVVHALLQVLLLSVAELRLEFSTRGQVDHVENTLSALHALGDDEHPSDLALSLDYRIQHLLIDEFQDTSVTQFELLEKLLRGWQCGDGRSLLLVGDPMQSIYRFRQAEVGLFLRARQHGVGDIALTPLYLTKNFRAAAPLIEWINQTFTQVFDGCEDPTTGAVAYSDATAVTSHPQARVSVHPFANWRQEAQRVVDIVRQCRKSRPSESIAILVRSRTHLTPLYPLLRANAIPYQAVGVETLADRPVVIDLMSLTRALAQPADRIAWLSVLRAPWCGLVLADLLALAETEAPVSTAVLDPGNDQRLSEDGAQRLQRLRPVMRAALRLAGRAPWRHLISSTWLALGGPACVAEADDMTAAEHFFEQLTAVQSESGGVSITALRTRITELVAPSRQSGEASVQLMTIHRAKGLEFDTVIVPNLGRSGRSDEPMPIRWLLNHDAGLLLAPAKRPDQKDPDALYQLIGTVERERADNELKRLLYVAVTRAKTQIHLLGHATESKAGLGCHRRSLLHSIWPQVESQFTARNSVTEAVVLATPTAERDPPLLQRLPRSWRLPPLREALNLQAAEPATERHPDDCESLIAFDWAGQTARNIGIVVHRYLQRIATEGVQCWPKSRVIAAAECLGADLMELGVTKTVCSRSVEHCQRALHNTLEDPRGRWLLAPYSQAASEFALSGIVDGKVKLQLIDRTFIDASGTRWIVDYKTGDHRGGSIDEFLDREQKRYRQQLDNYAAMMRHIDTRPIRLGLYFPMLQGWREWSYGGSGNR